jgi:hypothetical protein
MEGSARRSRRSWIAVIVTGLFALLGLSYGVNDYLDYSHGTPTTATIDRCGSGKGSTCSGTWSIGGVPQDGLIERGFSTPRTGSTVDVRVSDGKAYLAGAWLPSFAFGGFFLVASIGALIEGSGWRQRR